MRMNDTDQKSCSIKEGEWVQNSAMKAQVCIGA